ncbi:MAG: gamma-glutamylcyclotransferase [Candidatus Thiodiazotropha sp.]|jgi:gamma-glutamylcyclotransferase
MTRIHYFAYGSNLHPLRLKERAPSAHAIGVIEAKGKKLTFSKRGSKDHSGKCNFYESNNPSDVVFGVLYEMDSSEKVALDSAEGKGFGYNEQTVCLEFDGKTYSSFTYIADSRYIDESLRPYEWYKQFVIEGARYHSMPEKYISMLESIAAIPDPDSKRNGANMTRLSAMKKHTRRVK